MLLTVRFDVEVQISRHGYYEIFFDWHVVNIKRFEGLNKLKISGDEKNEKIEFIKKGFNSIRAPIQYKHQLPELY